MGFLELVQGSAQWFFATPAMWRPVPARARERSQVQARLTAADEVSDWLAARSVARWRP